MTTEITSAGGARCLTAVLRHEEQVKPLIASRDDPNLRRSLTTIAIPAAVLAALIAWEVRRFAELRDRLRHQIASDTAPA